jgi:hypothetical protein
MLRIQVFKGVPKEFAEVFQTSTVAVNKIAAGGRKKPIARRQQITQAQTIRSCASGESGLVDKKRQISSLPVAMDNPVVSGEWFGTRKLSNTCFVRCLYFLGMREML